MSAREVATRLAYRAVLSAERRQHRAGTLAPPRRLENALRRELRGERWKEQLLTARRAARPWFLSGADEQRRTRELFDTTFREERDDALRWAERARRHQFEFFGGDYQYGEVIDWQADPVTGARWPAVFHADVPVHGGDVGFGDVKHVWELSRQQYLIDLARSFFLTGNHEDVAAIRHLVTSWRAGNPYGTGVNWACALEPAFRVFSWLWAYSLTAPALDDEFHLEWLEGFHDHGRFLARHLENYSSPYNHLIGEATALYSLGACFPEFRASRSWKAQARDVLERRLGEQFYADGGSVEQSTFYHHATVGFYLLAALTARANGEELAPGVWRAIERGLEFSMWLAEPNGRTPAIGGADDGKPIRMEHLPFWDFRPYQAVGAVLYARPDFKAAAGRFFEDALWLLGPKGFDAFTAMPSTHAAGTSVLFRKSGYFVARSGWSSDADYVCFDVGEQAAGMRTDAVPNSMHGHADCLSVVLDLSGRRMLVDSGLFAYNSGGEWEAHFRETAAHNTARVDRADQARHLGKMAWSHSYRASIEGHMAEDRQLWTIASHDGYARGEHGVTHRRLVWLRPRYLVVCDEFIGRGDHELEVNWQFAPGALEMTGPASARFAADTAVCWTGGTPWLPVLKSGGQGPDDGWICPSLGVKTAAPRLTLSSRMSEGRAYLLTVFASGVRPEPMRAGAARLIAISGEDYVDVIAPRAGGEGSPIETDGLLALCRLAGARELERAQAGGTFVRVDPDALADAVRAAGPHK